MGASAFAEKEPEPGNGPVRLAVPIKVVLRECETGDHQQKRTVHDILIHKLDAACQKPDEKEENSQRRHVLFLVTALAAAYTYRSTNYQGTLPLEQAAARNALEMAYSEDYSTRYEDLNARISGAAALLMGDTESATKTAKEYIKQRALKESEYNQTWALICKLRDEAIEEAK
jgi:hypothetical protein